MISKKVKVLKKLKYWNIFYSELMNKLRRCSVIEFSCEVIKQQRGTP